MRRSLAIVLVLPFLVPAAAHGQTFAPNPPADAMQTKGPKLQVSIDRSKVDLAGHKLEVTLSRPCEKVRLKVLGQSGAVLAELEKAFNGAPAGTVLEVSWAPSSEEAVGRIEVWGHDTGGFFSGVAITPFNMEVGNEDVKFDTDSDAIHAAEAPKLEAILQKINNLVANNTTRGAITFYVLGHTDTVGSAEHNLDLSRRRARAIAAWFRAHGLKIPMAYEGVGVMMPTVKTGDQVDEPRNRRTGFFLGEDAPKLVASCSWKTI
jgi:outer membrane protein OmpA-like peptidoglycan-associated protein